MKRWYLVVTILTYSLPIIKAEICIWLRTKILFGLSSESRGKLKHFKSGVTHFHNLGIASFLNFLITYKSSVGVLTRYLPTENGRRWSFTALACIINAEDNKINAVVEGLEYIISKMVDVDRVSDMCRILQDQWVMKRLEDLCSEKKIYLHVDKKWILWKDSVGISYVLLMRSLGTIISFHSFSICKKILHSKCLAFDQILIRYRPHAELKLGFYFLIDEFPH